jgi:glycosyltransferase involved in cell wall biosynthesis
MNNTKEDTDITLTVVIPTLGGEGLVETINALRNGSVIPDKILICIPKGFEKSVNHLAGPGVEIFITKTKGQVSQRALGISASKSEYILQLDDDIHLAPQCLETLLETSIKLGSNVAVSPSFISTVSGKSLYKINTTSKLKKLYFWILNGKKGYQPGTLTLAGTCFGIDYELVDASEIEVDWLPGGCVLHHRDNVITENYYPFSGKAYAEDLYFSSIARSKGLKLYICTGANCQVEPMPPLVTMTYKEFKNFLASDLKVRKNFVIQSGLSLLRMYYFYLVIIAYYLAGKCRRIF